MKRTLLNLLMTIILVSNINGQTINKSNLYGDWYLNESNYGIRWDTMIFKREMIDSSFNKWSFYKNDTLCISSGYIYKFEKTGNNDHKLVFVKALSYYKWSFVISDNKKLTFKIIKNNSTDKYLVIYLDNDNLKIINEKAFAIDAVKKSHTESQSKNLDYKVVYYFTNLQIDTSIFQEDSLILSKEKIDIKSPVLKLLKDSTFRFYYNIDLDTIKVQDLKKGLLTDVIVDKSKKINGTWKTSDIRKNISLIFKDENLIDYSVIDKNNLIYFIRIK